MTDENSKALAKRDQRQVMTFDEAKQEVQLLNQFYKGLMQKGTDYDTIPGTPKPSLLKPGAEMLRNWFGFAPKFDFGNFGTDLEAGIFNYEVTCTLSKDGEFIGEGVGSCNSLESKYRYRWAWSSELPKTFNKEGAVTRWVKTKTGKQVPQYRLENDNPQDLANTILKMAKKRAFIDAILTVTGASRIFTQDVEDMDGVLAHEEPATEVPQDSPQSEQSVETPQGTHSWETTCPKHDVQWFDGQFGKSHKMEDGKTYCNANNLFKTYWEKLLERVGMAYGEGNDWLKEPENYGCTWSKLTHEQKIEAIFKLKAEKESRDAPAPAEPSVPSEEEPPVDEMI